jgi:cation diffusion facilitator CzcD-associated flavoprotein CzcO
VQSGDIARREFSGARPRIVIVGAGISGICAGIRLRQAGFDNVVILEKAGGVGGTWRDNIYPGAACDVPAGLYSFSFAQHWDWTQKYAPQAEILAYLEDCVRNFGLSSCIRFGAEAIAADYVSAARCWQVRLADGETIATDILIAATGQLHRPFIPEIPGRESFSGPNFHSARWRRDCDLAGRAVAIVGSAASAVQIAPAIAPAVRMLTVFQRSPNWMAPAPNRVYSRWWRALLKRHRRARWLYRCWQYAVHESYVFAFRTPSLVHWISQRVIAFKMRRAIADETLREALVPSYPLGCKRILRTPGYLEIFEREHVALVPDRIERIAPDGIVTRSGKLHPVDAIVYATGFRVSEFLAPMEIRGRDGCRLAAAWANGAEAHLGMTIPSFPNFFVLYGPNTNLGHNSVIVMIECQVAHIAKLLQRMRRGGKSEIEVRADAFKRFGDRIVKRMDKTVWAADCQSYYRTPAGRVVGIWPYSSLRYWWTLRRPRTGDYIFR